MALKSLHQRMTLHSHDDEYVFVPAHSGAQALSISRYEGDITLNAPNTPLPTSKGRTIYGIVGIISLSMTDYIIVITGRENCGPLMGHDVYHALDFDILPLGPGISVKDPGHPVESHLLALVRTHLNSGYFLFSYGTDLTRRMQAQYEAQEKDQGKALWEVADDRFFWNKFLHRRFLDVTYRGRQDLSPFILPVIYGTFDVQLTKLNGHRIALALISRRSRYRAGTRYFKRGVDHDGNVANFNETEQILVVESPDDNTSRMSFVQIRGSIPIFWAEVNNLRYMPDLQIMDLQDTADVLKLHLNDQVSRYGTTSIVNLINHKGHEKPIKDAYEKYLKQVNLEDVHYQYFDFHAECSKMRWDRISYLIEDMQEDLVKQGYFHVDSNSQRPIKMQTGVIRTNCMDNLDRTNVTQSAFARWTLERQLQVLGVLDQGDEIQYYEELDTIFRIMWSDHANLISTAYSGTPALKTDFTRTGKRTKMGAFEDFTKSAMRYLKNNYFDGIRQDGFDLMTGNFIPRRGPNALRALIVDNRPLLIRAMPYVAWWSLFMVFAGMTLPRTSAMSLLYYFLLWFTLLIGSTTFIFLHGTEYVSWPRLIPPVDVLMYTGPGYRARYDGTDVGVSVIDEKKAKWLTQGRYRAEARIEEVEKGGRKRYD